MYEFEMRAKEKDPSGYYFVRWDQAETLTVRAETRAKAIEKAKVVLGDVGYRYGWPWVFVVDSIKEV